MATLPEIDRCSQCGADLVSEPGLPGLCPHCLLSLALPAASKGHHNSGDEAVTLEHPFSPGRVLGERYQVRDVLGRGGMGEVFRAFDLRLRVDVALKAVRAGRFESERGREILRREVRAAREVVSPNVCRIFDLIVADGEELVSMEFIDGVTLTDRLRERGPLVLQEAREIASQFLCGLQAIHDAGLVHRDFKPENVMITRAGRVVVMDFGLAHVPTEGLTRSISGTPAYMAPEQAIGARVDARADVFAAGMVLAEMLAVGGKSSQESRKALWAAAREAPPRLPDGPWASVLRKALAPNPQDRHASAHALAHALDEVTQRSPGFEEKHPYPGLAAFTQENANYFFGREVEVEAVWKKLERPRLLALIGPSGAGKSSFLRAGLLPALPRTWTAIFTTPGNRPFQYLAQALAPAFAGDTQAVQALLRFDEVDVAIPLFQRLRGAHEQAVVIVDQFEELYTLNPPDVQDAFARLLGRLVLEADIHVILSLRDDFLIRCSASESLAPAFSDLTPLGPLGENGLRRALVQPALACGYRFEDESLIEEMINEVNKERGALPLLAFAAARLWDKRDREHGLLTRQSHREIGGVAGALAQHAEEALGAIGSHRIPIVREMFGNLVTAQGTRAVRERGELLSVFDRADAAVGNREQAEEVLNALVAARLLTTYEREGDEGGSRQEVEIIHESLLTAWPRLVRWRTQDADGTQLRDQLRQAAQAWQERGRPEDLLWSGTAYRDFTVWKERYTGGLSATEDAFVQAAARHVGRKRRRRRLAAAVGVAAVAAVAVTTSVLWRRSEVSRRQAEAETRRAEASKLLVMGERELARYPTAALAYTIKSLELADTEVGRLQATRVLQHAPVARLTGVGAATATSEIAFSPNGEWIAWGGSQKVELLHWEGERHLVLGDQFGPGPMPVQVQFGAASDMLVGNRLGDIRVWSVPDGRELRRLRAEQGSSLLHALPTAKDTFLTLTRTGPQQVLRAWPLASGDARLIGSIDVAGLGHVAASGASLAYRKDRGVYVRSLSDWTAAPRLIAEQANEFTRVSLSPDGSHVAVSDASHEIRTWPASARSVRPARVLVASANAVGAGYDLTGRWIYALTFDRGYPAVQLFDLKAPRGAEPVTLQKGDTSNAGNMAFTPSGLWLATTHGTDVAFWHLGSPRPYVLKAESASTAVVFSRDGRRIFSVGVDRKVWAWPLDGSGEATGVLEGTAQIPVTYKTELDHRGRMLALTGVPGVLALLDLGTGSVRRLPGIPERGFIGRPGFGPDDRFVAAGLEGGPQQDKVIRVWDLESGGLRTFGPLTGAGNGTTGGVGDVHFTGQDHLLAAVEGQGLVSLDLTTGSSRVVVPQSLREFILSREGRSGIGLTRDRAGRVFRFRLDDGSSQPFEAHGGAVTAIAMDASETLVATGSADGTVRVGRITGEEPHVLLGQQGSIHSIAFSPDGRWIATGGEAFAIHLWPVPDVSKPPLHRRSHDELMAVLRSHTNLQAVPDPSSATGYKLAPGPFPGWARVPQW